MILIIGNHLRRVIEWGYHEQYPIWESKMMAGRWEKPASIERGLWKKKHANKFGLFREAMFERVR